MQINLNNFVSSRILPEKSLSKRGSTEQYNVITCTSRGDGIRDIQKSVYIFLTVIFKVSVYEIVTSQTYNRPYQNTIVWCFKNSIPHSCRSWCTSFSVMHAICMLTICQELNLNMHIKLRWELTLICTTYSATY